MVSDLTVLDACPASGHTLMAPLRASHAISEMPQCRGAQAFGRRVQDEDTRAGIRYESVRHPGHEYWVCFRPSLVLNVTQADQFRIEVPRSGRVVVRQLS